jgi:hypothetical protein
MPSDLLALFERLVMAVEEQNHLIGQVLQINAALLEDAAGQEEEPEHTSYLSGKPDR